MNDPAQAWQARLDDLLARHPDLDVLAAGILAALQLSLTRDSRSFARDFGIAHALVLRACGTLQQSGLVQCLHRDDRTQKLVLQPCADL